MISQQKGYEKDNASVLVSVIPQVLLLGWEQR
jgi:hypothetical protein